MPRLLWVGMVVTLLLLVFAALARAAGNPIITAGVGASGQDPSGNPRFAITTNGPNNEQRIDGTAPLPVDRWTYVAVTKSALGAQL